MREGKTRKAGHRLPTAHARARYRCFLPDLAGLAGRRCVGPMSDQSNFIKDRESVLRAESMALRMEISISGAAAYHLVLSVYSVGVHH